MAVSLSEYDTDGLCFVGLYFPLNNAFALSIVGAPRRQKTGPHKSCREVFRKNHDPDWCKRRRSVEKQLINVARPFNGTAR